MRFSIVIAIGLCATSAHADMLKIGETGVTAYDVFACKSANDFDRWRQFIAANDMVAVARFQLSKIDSGACDHIPGGVKVRIENSSVSERYCVRPVGDIECLWTGTASIGR
jgi:hypothetical protein